MQPRNQEGLPDATGYHSGYLFQITAEIDSEDRKSWQLDFERGAHAYDFFYYMDQKPDGYVYPSVVSTPKYDGGRYNNGYYDAVVGSGHTGAIAIEPMVLHDAWRNDVETTLRTPALEVMVVLMVKLREHETPLLYVRHYLPEVKQLWVGHSEFLPANTSIWQNIKARQPKGTGINRQSPVYDYEMLRIGKLLEYVNPGFKAE